MDAGVEFSSIQGIPFDSHGQPMCAYSADRKELWVSLLEKAYLKVMGGYDFPGSNSSVDLHALTGWIPERKNLREKDAVTYFDLLAQRTSTGHVLATMATIGDLSEELEAKSGLVPGHAYALLGLRKVGDKRFVKLKNPWSEKRWLGAYSHIDTKRWTPDLKKALNYDPSAKDEGIFWIEWNDLVVFFDTCYMSWDPTIFRYSSKFHGEWLQGPAKDVYTMSGNPQYLLEVNAPTDSFIWIVLARHITQKADFANNQHFITLIVYEYVL